MSLTPDGNGSFSERMEVKSFSSPLDSAAINAKTSNPSDVYINVAILYRLRKENLVDLYNKWPTQNYQSTFVLMAKVSILL